jgi:hypothetical protein
MLRRSMGREIKLIRRNAWRMLAVMKNGMVSRLMVPLWLLLGGVLPAKSPVPYDLREGDILFSSSAVGQGSAIIAATGSPYTHCGVVFRQEDRLMVLEAVQPVKVSTVADFYSRGRPEAFAVKRLKSPVTPESYRKAREWAAKQVGLNYDARFLWGDDRLYCSELVWKVFKQAGVELCALKKFKDYQLERPEVRRIIDERFGGMDKVPMNEQVVAPSDLADSKLLEDVPKVKNG